MRIALYGGTYDPVHRAHVTVAEEAVRAARLDRVLLVPAADPPHKPGRAAAPYEDRLRMVELAVAGHAGLEASDLERRQGRSYSIDTILQVRRTVSPEDELFFLIGADAFAEIQTWHRWRDVIREVTFLVVSRPGYAYEIPEGARVVALDGLALPTSSSGIREQLSRGKCPENMIPEVLGYIAQHGLYGFRAGERCAIL